MLRIVVFIWVGISLCVQVHAAEDGELYGIVKQVPGADSDSWRVGGQEVAIRQDTERKLKSGGLVVGACAEISSKGGSISRVETGPMSWCDTTNYDAYLAGFASLAAEPSS